MPDPYTPDDRATRARDAQHFETPDQEDRSYRVIGWLFGAMVAVLIGATLAWWVW